MKIFGTIGGKKPLKILFVAAEAAPFAKVGGLGSVMYSLTKALSRLGHDVRVMMPRYLSISDEAYHLTLEYKGLKVPTGNEKGETDLVCNVKRYNPGTDSEDPVITYFLENQEYYEQRANVYGYADDAARWLMLCRGALEFVRAKTGWTPDVIVSCDWQAALIPNLLKTVYKADPILSKVASVLSIHNLYFQGMFDHHFVSEMDFDDGHSPVPPMESERLSKINWMRRGIIYADIVNTVSPNYAKEIMTKDYGELLDELLRERKSRLSGILNGIDYMVWNPKTDPYIAETYDAHTLEMRQKNKVALQERFGLPVNPKAFVVAYVGRFTKQKGLDLFSPIAETLLRELPMQFIAVGEGDADIMTFLHDLETKFPDKVAVHLKFDPILPHIVDAGTDAIIMPSRFEPCGLSQMEAMRMGAIPIVRKTGGLADSVEDYNPEKGTGTGFVFEKFDSSSLMVAFIRAFENFRDKPKWRALQARAMEKDFSWDNSAKKYAALFVRAIEAHHLS
ncbi:MAG TPA: glycogen/starch synthase [Candidatus Paceibacterota bacterium]|nr:glycogen/starch synthase [Candidatus Paceibacterota bacterium]